jgi:hypothetical protein
MAIFTRINGDAAGVVNVDAGRVFGNSTIINTGIAAPLTAYKVTIVPGATTNTGAGNLAAELTTGGAVETILRIIEGNATVLAYQTDAASANSQLSVLVERSGWTDATIQAAVRQTTAGDGAGNIGALANCWVGAATVTSTGGIKFA